MDFFLFVLLTGVMFVRPTDFLPGLENVPLYLVVILSCLLVSGGRLMSRLSGEAFREDPASRMIVGILLVSIVSNLAHRDLEMAFDFASDFVKTAIYYFLLMGIVNSPARLRSFLTWLIIFSLIPTVLALLQYHGMINIPAFTALEEGLQADPFSGGPTSVKRLHATGNFGDPNDACTIFNTAMVFSIYRLLESRKGPARYLWLVPVVLFGFALYLTRSRGGFLGALAGIFVIFLVKYGLRKSVVLIAITLPLVLVLFSGRQTSLNTSEGTSQGRIQLWSACFDLLRRSPIWGIGVGQVGVNLGLVAHNAYVHAYTELGFVGGTFFFGAFYSVLRGLWRLSSNSSSVQDPEIRRVSPYILGAVASYAVSQMSVSLCYRIATYAFLGVGAVCIRLGNLNRPLTDRQEEKLSLFQLFRASLIFLVALNIFVRLTVKL
ncbi:MAG: O-antigen ligase family protein [Isosphaeraceae bacterium]